MFCLLLSGHACFPVLLLMLKYYVVVLACVVACTFVGSVTCSNYYEI